MRLVEIDLERENAQHLSRQPTNLSHTAFSPRPQLRRNIEHYRNLELLEARGESEIEVWRIYQHRDCGAAPPGFIHQTDHHLSDPRQLAKYLDQTHMGEFFCSGHDLESSGSQPVAADTEGLHRWCQPPKFSEHVAGVHVAGHLSCDNQDLARIHLPDSTVVRPVRT
jgi:hypothetical protein